MQNLRRILLVWSLLAGVLFVGLGIYDFARVKLADRRYERAAAMENPAFADWRAKHAVLDVNRAQYKPWSFKHAVKGHRMTYILSAAFGVVFFATARAIKPVDKE